MDEIPSVSVWFGGFPSEEDLLEYLGGSFAEDMGQDTIDPDFVEASWQDPPSAEARVLLHDHTGAPAYVEAVEAAWSGALEVNVVVLVFGGRVAAPRSVVGPDFVLQFVGTFGPGAVG